MPFMAAGTPIKPTPKQVLQDAKSPADDFIPARAGWNGPEEPSGRAVSPLAERFQPAAQMRANRQALMALALPDLRLWGMLVVMILGLRWVRYRHDRRKLGPVLVEQPRREQPPSHLRAA